MSDALSPDVLSPHDLSSTDMDAVDLGNDVATAELPVAELPSTQSPSTQSPKPVTDTATAPAPTSQATSAPESAFAALGLDPLIQAALVKAGISAPTPVQEQAIPKLLAGKDLIASAPTGTGKTAAFLLPALQRLLTATEVKGSGPRVLVLTPTRELAQQVAQAAQQFSVNMKRCKTVCITGGESYNIQNRFLASPYDILVATPGRLMDQMNNGRIDFARLQVLVLDEADRMLDMGFAEDVLHISQALPRQRQTVCFTATLSSSVRQLTDQLLRSPEWLEVAQQTARHDSIDQKVIYVDGGDHKRNLLRHWLASADLEQAIVFTATKRDAEQLADELEDAGLPAVALHGDLMQRQRTRTLNRLRRGDCKILVATDVAARGLDVAAISHVFNFDLPRFAEDYVHRIGRTGRAGATGTAISFVSRQDVPSLIRIERFIGFKVQVTEVGGLEARFKPSDKPGGDRRPGGEGGGGGRRSGGGGGGSYGNASRGRPSTSDTRSSWGARDAAPRSAERSFSRDRPPAAGGGGMRGDAPARPSFGRDAAPRSRFGGRDSAPRSSGGFSADAPRSFGAPRDASPRAERGYGAASGAPRSATTATRSSAGAGHGHSRSDAPSRPAFAGDRAGGGGMRRERGGRY